LEQAALGIPAGVKIHSAVYATSPRSAGELALLYLQGRVEGLREAEVMDIDEEAFRQGALAARLYGYLKVPYRMSLVQSQKVPSAGEGAALAAIAEDVAEKMEDGVLYLIGPGTTTRAIAEELGLEKTLLGVDVVLDRALIASDTNESELLALLDDHGEHPARIIVTPIGGQGYLFGRGNQQISPRVIEKVGRENVLVVSTPDKLYALGSQPLLVDTGDRVVDEMLSGYIMVVTGYNERAVRKVGC
jgi:predicted polyphosphate/ATP-dependent NAD kinase